VAYAACTALTFAFGHSSYNGNCNGHPNCAQMYAAKYGYISNCATSSPPTHTHPHLYPWACERAHIHTYMITCCSPGLLLLP